MTDQHFSIIGCGFSGIGMAIKLKEAGYHNFTIFEKASSFGGTWKENTYPDCGCDIPSAMYSYSFENFPDWDRVWSKQPQILAYQEHCMKKYGLFPHLKVNSMMRESKWDPDTATWTLTIEDTTSGQKRTVTSTFLLMAQGTLHVPQFPNIKGVNLENGSSPFRGPSFHSAEWNHEHNLEGKRVAVIGSGASAIQLVPEVAKIAKELYVFQRTAPYVQYKSDFAIPTCFKYVFRYVPFAMSVFRWGLYIATEVRFPGLYANSWMNAWIKWDNLRYLRSIVKDPALQKKLIPTTELGCKRMLFSNFWYPALVQSNVHVVSEKLVGVAEKGIEIESPDGNGTKLIEVDIIVYSTGFQYTRLSAPPKHQFDVIGKDGTSLTKWFQKGPKSLLGVTAPQFPNLFFLYGPNSNLGHSSIIFMIECQVNYIIQLLKMAKKKMWKHVEVKEEAVEEFHANQIRKNFAGKVWDTCNSWYRWPVKNEETGEVTLTGEVYSLWPSSTLWYYWQSLWPTESHFKDIK